MYGLKSDIGKNKTNMKRTLKILGLLLLLLVIYVLYVFNTTGFFREIKNSFSGKIEKKIALPGVEDMQISYEDNFILLSSDDRAGRRDGNPQQGHLYYIDLTDQKLQPVQLTTDFKKPFFPHGISMVRTGPQVYKVYAISHMSETDHTIEVFNLYNDSLVHVETLKDPAMVSPNDMVALDGKRFYFTNDHGYTEGFGKLTEEYLGRAVSTVYYFDGKNYREVADGIAYANGINFDAARNLLFVASPRGFLVNVYHVQDNGDLVFVEDIDCGTGVDNIEFAPDGKLWIGCHPSLLTFAEYAKGNLDISPSEIITIDYKGKGDYQVESIFMDDGNEMSAATVAPVYNNRIFVGNVMDDEFLVLVRE